MRAVSTTILRLKECRAHPFFPSHLSLKLGSPKQKNDIKFGDEIQAPEISSLSGQSAYVRAQIGWDSIALGQFWYVNGQYSDKHLWEIRLPRCDSISIRWGSVSAPRYVYRGILRSERSLFLLTSRMYDRRNSFVSETTVPCHMNSSQQADCIIRTFIEPTLTISVENWSILVVPPFDWTWCFLPRFLWREFVLSYGTKAISPYVSLAARLSI